MRMQLKDGKLVPAGEGKTVEVSSVPTPPMPPTKSQEEVIYNEMQKRFAEEQRISQAAMQKPIEQPQYQPQYHQEQPQQQPQQPQHLLVKINFVGGTTVDVASPKEIVKQFLDELALKIKLKDLMTIENRVINCELVTDFVVE